MPQKPQPHTRSWGTRFDSLISSPPPSPDPAGGVVAQDSVTCDASNTDTNTLEALPKRKEEKMPHDASVFVGSLPSNMEQPELARLLTEHLSEHAEVKNVKVVRDSKGGVCAFVQCQDAFSAARLIHTIHSNEPKPFLGRFLRYEPARAFRTLLVSYRTPMRFLPPGSAEAHGMSDEANNNGKMVPLELPTSMRLWRPRNAKFLNILYNAEARNFDSQNLVPSHGFDTEAPQTLGILLNPLSFDAEAIQDIAQFFGPLEHFGPYKGIAPLEQVSQSEEDKGTAPNLSSETSTIYPSPHHAPRSPEMDVGCWEIKWDHRDDCVSALMTLRRVPHLTVTWAHQPASYGYEHQTQRFSHSTVAPYPYHVEDPRGNNTHFNHIPHNPTFALPVQRNDIPTQSTGLTTDTGDAKLPLSPSTAPQDQFGGDHLQPLRAKETGKESQTTKKLEWTETDFPPLCDRKGDRRVDAGVWSDKKNQTADKEEAAGSHSSPLVTPRVAVASLPNSDDDPVAVETVDQVDGQDLDIPPTPEFGRSPLTPKTPQFPQTPSTGNFNDDFKTLSFQRPVTKEKDSYFGDAIGGEREVDPTTIFVGGLEMYGPAAWDEAKVQAFFGKFGGVENVKVVRPVNGRSAFAFVKFDNKDAPARAIFEEHNSIHDGRHMRVQLRDCNPPNRGAWKYGRGRGRYQHYGSSRHHADPSVTLNETLALLGGGKGAPFDKRHSAEIMTQYIAASSPEKRVDVEPSSSGKVDVLHSSVVPERFESDTISAGDIQLNENETNDDFASNPPPMGSRLSSPAHSSSKDVSSGYEHYREWYQQDASSHTPPSSSLGSSASATAPVPYSIPNAGYYSPAWMQPYAPQLQYQMPFIPGYTGFGMQATQVPPTYTSSGGSDASGPASGAANPWAAMGSMFTPFMPYPAYHLRAPSLDQSQVQQTQQPHTQAPLIATRFIQGDQGTLIPVYQPEALDHYMSGSQTTPPPQPQTQQAQIPSTWPQQPLAPPYPFQVPIPHGGLPILSLPSVSANQAPSQPHPGTNVGWNALIGMPAPQHQQHQLPPVPFNTPTRPTAGTFHGQYFGVGPGGQPVDQRYTTPPSRRPQHRDQQPTFNNMNRNNHNSRGGYLRNRGARGGMNGGEHHVDYGARQPGTGVPPQTGYNPGGNDWSQWTAGR